MKTYIALLRAVNLAGHNRIGMDALRALLTDLGMRDVRTVLQSGNAVFRSDARTGKLEQTLTDAFAARLGFQTDLFVRTVDEWKDVIASNPFRSEAKRDPSHLLVMVLHQQPDRARVETLQQAIKGREMVRSVGRCAYVTYPDGIGRSPLTAAVIEKALGARGTGRNWNTVLKLGALAHVLA